MPVSRYAGRRFSQFGNNLTGIIGGASSLKRPIANPMDISMTSTSRIRPYGRSVAEGVQNGCISASTFVDNAGGRNGFKAGQIAMVYEAAGRWISHDSINLRTCHSPHSEERNLRVKQ